MRFVKLAKRVRTTTQYDNFLYRIQQKKMKELWDNTYDEEWEDA